MKSQRRESVELDQSPPEHPHSRARLPHFRLQHDSLRGIAHTHRTETNWLRGAGREDANIDSPSRICRVAGNRRIIYVALVGGDLVSKEAEDGTLRMMLSRPISRVRIVVLKWLAGIVFSASLVAVLGISGWVFSSIWFPPTSGLFVWLPGEIFAIHSFWTGVQHYAAAHVVMISKAVTIMTLALMFSCFNMKPAAATILALSVMLINGILMEIPYFRDFQYWFLTYHLNVWRLLLDEQIPWWRVLSSLSVLAACNVTFLVIGCAALHSRDIKS